MSDEDYDDPLNDILEGRIEGEDEYIIQKQQRSEQGPKRKSHGSSNTREAKSNLNRKGASSTRLRKGDPSNDDRDIRNFIADDLGLGAFSDEDDDGNVDGERDDEAVEVNARSKTKPDPNGKEIKVRRIVKNPQPKLDVPRLASSKGLSELAKQGKKLKLKGKGHELEDIDEVLKTISLWSHRLFPKLTFDDFIARCEDFKKAKPLVSKLRHGMPLGAGDFITQNMDDEEQEGTAQTHEKDLFDSLNNDAEEGFAPRQYDSDDEQLYDPTQRMLSQIVGQLDDGFDEEFDTTDNNHVPPDSGKRTMTEADKPDENSSLKTGNVSHESDEDAHADLEDILALINE